MSRVVHFEMHATGPDDLIGVYGPLDGWHLEAREHETLGVATAAGVRRMLR